MAHRAKRPCNKPGCAESVISGYCTTHAHLTKERDLWRGTSASRGYDNDWRRIRERALKRDHYLCQHCLSSGRARPARDVDHIQPISRAPQLRLDLSNLQSLCRQCHATKTATEPH